MIFAQFSCVPNRKHPDFDRVGRASVNCWLRVRSFEEAKAIAKRRLLSDQWKILALNEICRVSPGRLQPNAPGLQYYEQALVDREVYVFYQCPKWQFFCVEFEITPTKSNKRFPHGTVICAEYLVVNEEISTTSDPFDNFWGKKIHARKAVSLGRKRVQSEDWRVTEVLGAGPVSFGSYAKDAVMTEYLEEAEEYGDCLVLWLE